jgi:3',5'-cyclic AMP phosphodiesterase CpdA
MRRVISGCAVLLFVLGAAAVASRAPSAAVSVPVQDAIHFAIIGDMGTGGRAQLEVGATMDKVRRGRFPFNFVLTVGDNMYGAERARDYERKFTIPYKALLDEDVTFHASLGNHDDTTQRYYKPFNMNGDRYYTFRKGPARFFALDSTYMTPEQLRWLEKELADSDAPWKIAYMHHPLYSSGRRHGAELDLRRVIEPLLMKYKVQVMFTGHEHFYERYTPQNGVQHFITGAGGRLRLLNIKRTKDTAAGYDTDNSFMVARIRGDEMYFEAINRRGVVIDAGIVDRQGGTRPVPVTGGKP